jgi:phospholipase C
MANESPRNVTGLTDEAEFLLPYWLNYLGGEENINKSQCLCAGPNNWIPTQQAMNNGSMDMWAQVSTPQSWGHFKREDIPYHFGLAEAFTVGDAYHAAITSNTDPNRWFWQVRTTLFLPVLRLGRTFFVKIASLFFCGLAR